MAGEEGGVAGTGEEEEGGEDRGDSHEKSKSSYSCLVI